MAVNRVGEKSAQTLVILIFVIMFALKLAWVVERYLLHTMFYHKELVTDLAKRKMRKHLELHDDPLILDEAIKKWAKSN